MFEAARRSKAQQAKRLTASKQKRQQKQKKGARAHPVDL
jgi:hypothetical protein